MYTVTYETMNGYSFTREFSTLKDAEKLYGYIEWALYVGQAVTLANGDTVIAHYEK